MSFFDDLWERLFGADKAADDYPDEKPESNSTACPLKTEPYLVRVTVKTRAGEIPVNGVKVSLGDAVLGVSGRGGKVADSPLRSLNSFKLTASYANAGEKLKREEYALSVKDIVLPGGSFSASAANEIKKIRDVIGNRDDQDFLDPYTPSAAEVRYENIGGQHIIHVLIHLATLSLNVKYLNQNSKTDTVQTSAAKDPEGSSHEVRGDSVDGKFSGGILCFASSTTMLLWYWGKDEVTREEVIQKCYDVWAAKNFENRVGLGAVKSAEAPENPAANSYWLKTAVPVPAAGYTLKRWVEIRDWQADTEDTPPTFTQRTEPPVASVGNIWVNNRRTPFVRKKLISKEMKWVDISEADWRVMRRDPETGGSYKIWTKWDYHKNAIKALKPDETDLNDKVNGIPIDELADEFELTGGTGTYAAVIATKLAKGYPGVFSTNATSFGHVMIARGCVMDHEGKVHRLIVNDPYGNLESPTSLLHQYKINASVGQGGVNNSEDVAEVQTILQLLDHWPGEIDGECDGTGEDELVKAIKKYQKSAKLASKPDGIVKPGEKTDKKLARIKGAGGYSKEEKESNARGTGSEATTKGRHAYYDSNTEVPGGTMRLKGKWRGTVMLEKQAPFPLSELTGKLTPNE